jgi:hypothetical protein
VQERAAEIAREFAKSVLSFEERLVACKTLGLLWMLMMARVVD